jgi:uncharacterized membrane protein
MSQSIVIKSAKFGDEFSSTDVTQTLQDAYKSKGTISVDVDSSLIPVLARATGRGAVTLTAAERDAIKEEAANQCGAADQTCLEIKTQEMAQSKLKDKEASTINSANIVKGRRGTFEVIVNGKPQTIVVPEGQKFELGSLAPKPASKPIRLGELTSPWTSLFSSVWAVVGTSVLTFLYVTSIIITWMTYIKRGNRYLAIGMTIIAICIPLSGFGLSFLVPAASEAFKVTMAQSAVAEKLTE